MKLPRLLAAISLSLGTSIFYPMMSEATCVTTAQSIANAANAPVVLNTQTPVEGSDTVTATPVLVQDTCGGDDVSYQVALPTAINFQGTEYNAVYATTNSTIVFGTPDNNYSSFPTTPSISINAYDWVVLKPTDSSSNPYPAGWKAADEHLIITSSQAGFQVNLAVRPYGQNASANPLSTIVVTAAINPDSTLTITYLSDVQAGLNTRTGVRLPDGRVVSLEEAGLTRVYVAPVVTADIIEPAPTPSPSSEPTPTPSPSSSPEPSPTPTALPTPVPSPEPTVTPTPVPSPTSTPESSASPSPIPSPDTSTIAPIPPTPLPTPEPSPTPPVPVEPTPIPVVPPVVEPTPLPIPTPVIPPEPSPEPVPEPQPEPVPLPQPETVPVPPEPAPEPVPVPTEPAPEPAEIPEVAPEPEPVPPVVEPPVIVDDWTVPPEEAPPVAPEPPIAIPDPEPVPVEPAPEPAPEPEVTPVPPTPEPAPEPAPEPPVVPNVVPPIVATEDSTPAERAAVAETLIEAAQGAPVTAQAIQEAGLTYEDLPPETPVEVRQDENGNEVVITAEVAAALVVLESPAALVEAIFSDPRQALLALANIGADMSEEEREEAEKIIVASVIAGQAAVNAAGMAGAAAYRRKP